jgi:hypothetical protein
MDSIIEVPKMWQDLVQTSLDSQWTLEPAMELPEPVEGHCAVYIAGNIVVLGGIFHEHRNTVLALNYEDFFGT